MIERRHLPIPGWRIETPEWVRRLQDSASYSPQGADDGANAERAAKRVATTHRADGLRVDAERSFFGLSDR